MNEHRPDLVLDLQQASRFHPIPRRSQFEDWARAALLGRREEVELTIRLVDRPESAQLNQRFRGKVGPTNVLSFPFEAPPDVPPLPLLGDLVICVPLVIQEAREQGKSIQAHWAHLVIHGVLHLLGYDHETEDQAAQMESLETRLLQGLGFPPPYAMP